MLPQYPKKRQRILSRVRTWVEKEIEKLNNPGRVGAVILKYKGVFGDYNYILRRAGETEGGEVVGSQAEAHKVWATKSQWEVKA